MDSVIGEGAIRMTCFRWHGNPLAGFSRRVGAVLLIALVAGCATVTPSSSDEDKRKVVSERANARWALILRGEADVAYDQFMSKGSRQVISRNEFVGRMQITAFRKAAVEAVECAGESCKVSVGIVYDHPLMKGVTNTLRELWVIDDGQLWFVWSQ